MCDPHREDWYGRIIPSFNPDILVLANRGWDAPGNVLNVWIDKKRVLRAWEDYRRVQKKFDDEPDLATKMSLQAEAMRREIRHIDSIQFSF